MAAAANGLRVRYAAGRLMVESSLAGDVLVSVTNLSGQKMLATMSRVSNGHAEIDTTSLLRDGVYLAIVSHRNGNKAVCKFVIN